MKMRKVISAFLAILCAFSTVSLLTLGVSAESGRTVYATTNNTVQQGNYAYLYVYLDDLTELSALSVSVYYDTEKIAVSDAYNAVSSTVYDITAEDGCVNASYIFDGKGEATKTNLFYIRYQVLSDAEVGDTYFDIVVTEAYNNSLKDVSISGSRCAFAVTEQSATQSCQITSSSTVFTSVGEEFELAYRLSTYQIASGAMSIQYDPDLFEVISVEQGAFLDGKIADINTELDGSVYVSFVGTKYQYGYDVVTVRFKTVKNVAESSDINLTVSELHDSELTPYVCSGYTSRVNVAFDDTYTEDAPSMSVTASYSKHTGKVTATIRLEKDSMLGAGDFVLNFDPDALTYVSAQKGFEPTFFVVNENGVSDGVVKFYIISTENIVDEQTILTVTFDVKTAEEDQWADFEINGSMLTDALSNTITLNFVDGSVAIPSLAAADFVFALNDSGTEYSVVDYTGTSAEVIIPNVYMGLPVTKIELYAFENCTSLTSITIPHSITDISSCAFLGCTSLTSITVALENDKYHSAGNCLIETGSKMLILGCKTGIIPTDGSVTSIGDFAFAYCEGLTSITIPDSVASIGKDAFMQCVNLETIAGYSGSAAEAYAQEHNITFVSLDEPQGIPGDIDANGEVTVKDAVLLFRYVAEWDVEVDEDALDVTGDGEVTVKDAILLFRYIAEWDVEIYRGQR